MINANPLNIVNTYFNTHAHQSFVVKPSIPILYFGDEVAYRKSRIKVITVGKNPSLNEFYNRSTKQFNISYRFPKWNGTNLTSVLDEYFRQNPLDQWFSSFEPILNGLNGSFYSNTNFQNIILHTDICSPIATDPTWGGLTTTQQILLFTQGLKIWWDLVYDLAPDIILVSIPRNQFLKIINNNLGLPFHTIFNKKNGSQRKRPYIVYRQHLNINGKNTKVIFGQAANKPFDTITTADKLLIGGLI